MSYIKTITAKNLKGRSFERHFSPLSMIVGANMTGKSAVLDAIRLTLNGRTLGIKATAPDIFNALCSGDALSCSVTFDDGSSIERAWTRRGDKVSAVVRNPQNINVTPVLLDSNEFFGLSPEARLALLFSRMSLGREPIQMRVGKVMDRLAGLPESKELLLKKYPPSPEETFQAYLERVIERLGEESRDQSAVFRRQRETTAGLIQQQIEREKDAGADDREEEVRADLAAAQKAVEALIVKGTAAKERQAARAPSLQRRTRLKEAIEGYKPAAASFETYEQNIRDTEAALASYADAESVQTASGRLNDLTRQRSEATGTRAAAEKRLRQVEQEHALILNAECCPTCTTKRTGWKAATVERFEVQQKELTTTTTEADATLLRLAEEIAAAEKALLTAQEIERAKREATRLRDRQAGDLDRAKTAREFIAEVGPELADLERAFPPDAADTDEAELVGLRGELGEARKVVLTHEARLQKISDGRLLTQQIAEASAARDRAENLAAAYKAGQHQLQEVRDGFMADAFKPLLASVNRYAKSILKSPLEFRANTLGRINPERGNWIPAAAFSGTETAVLLAGVQLALGSESTAKLAIVDELGRLDGDRKRQLLRNVQEAISCGELDQFIGIDVSDEAYTALIKPTDLKVTPMAINIVRVAEPVVAHA